MANGSCDWQGCDSPHIQPAIVRLHEDDHGRGQATHEYQFKLCPEHTSALTLWIEHTPLHEAPVVR